MRLAILTAVIAVLSCGAAAAADFIVVRSSDPKIPKAASFSFGERVMLAPGASMTLITAAGQVVTFAGQTGGVRLPTFEGGDASRFSALMALVSRPPPRRTFGALRSEDPSCAPAETLTTLDAILMAEEAGCASSAATALETYLSAAAAPAPGAAAEPTPAGSP